MKTNGVKNLVNTVLSTFPKPYSEHIIEEIFISIENNPQWLLEYEGLCVDLGKTVVNSLGGYWIGRALGKHGKKQVQSKKSALLGSYSILDTDTVPVARKPKESEALQLMAQYYQANKASLPSNIKIYRTEILELLVDGISPEEAFNTVLASIT